MATTTHYGIELPTSGSHPGATVLNNNWTIIDSQLYSASSAVISTMSPISQSGGSYTVKPGTNLEIVGDAIAVTGSPSFTGLKVSGNISASSFLATDQSHFTSNLVVGAYISPTEKFYVKGNTYLSGSLTVVGDIQLQSKNHGNFFSTASQTIVSTTATQSVTYNGTADVEGLIWTPASSSKIYSTLTGDYLIAVSAICDVTAPNKHINMWAAIDGTNIPNSNTIVQLPSATTETILAVSFILDINSGSYFELKMWGDDTGNQLLATSGSAYGIPWCPSIITTMHKID